MKKVIVIAGVLLLAVFTQASSMSKMQEHIKEAEKEATEVDVADMQEEDHAVDWTTYDTADDRIDDNEKAPTDADIPQYFIDLFGEQKEAKPSLLTKVKEGAKKLGKKIKTAAKKGVKKAAKVAKKLAKKAKKALKKMAKATGKAEKKAAAKKMKKALKKAKKAAKKEEETPDENA